jgi:hypothetical protein
MRALRDRLLKSEGAAGLCVNGIPGAEIVSRLTAGVPPANRVGPGGLAPVDLIAAIAHEALGAGDDALGPALVQARPFSAGLQSALSEPAWAAVFPGASQPARLCLAAGLLQVHDFWDASHDAAQKADDQGERAVSAYWHGIAHRREPDAGNAAYWFRRVGKHPVFEPLAMEARILLEKHGDSRLSGRLMPAGAWDATAMIDLCTGAKPGTPDEALARRLQRAEMWLLLEATYTALAR